MYFKYFKNVDYDVYNTGTTVNMVNLTNFTGIASNLLDDKTRYSYYTIRDGDRPDNVSQELYGDPSLYWTFFLLNPSLKNRWSSWPKNTNELIDYVETKYPTVTGISVDWDDVVDKFVIGENIIGSLSSAVGTIVSKNVTDKLVEIKIISGTFREQGESIYGISSQDSVECESVVKTAYAPAYYKDLSTGERTPRRTAGVMAISNYDVEIEESTNNSKIRVIKKEHIKEMIREFAREMSK